MDDRSPKTTTRFLEQLLAAYSEKAQDEPSREARATPRQRRKADRARKHFDLVRRLTEVSTT